MYYYYYYYYYRGLDKRDHHRSAAIYLFMFLLHRKQLVWLFVFRRFASSWDGVSDRDRFRQCCPTCHMLPPSEID